MNLIKATQAYVFQQTGRTISAVEPFNEPDYWAGQGTPEELNAIMTAMAADPAFNGVLLQGASTLASENAYYWYDRIRGPATSGSTHLLGSGSDALTSYAGFFDYVKNGSPDDIPYNPEIHSMPELLVGADRGMEGGIFWGAIERPRALAVLASDGARLGYAEELVNQAAAAVYRGPDGEILGFAGGVERAGVPMQFEFTSTTGPVWYNGIGPINSFAALTDLDQSTYVDIDTNATEAPPALDGMRWKIVNRATNELLDVFGANTADGGNIVLWPDNGGLNQLWNIQQTFHEYGNFIHLDGYLTISNANSGLTAEVANFSLDDGANVQQWGTGGNMTRSWYIEPTGDGFYYIRNAHSNSYLSGTGAAMGNVTQGDFTGASIQQCEFVLANPDLASGLQMSQNDDGAFGIGSTLGGPVYVDNPTAGGPSDTKSLLLDGIDDFVDLGVGVANSKDLSVATWVKWNGGDSWQRIFDFGNNTDEYFFLTPSSGDGTLRFSIKNGASTTELKLDAPQLQVGEWHHVAITLGGNTGVLYVDGAPVSAGQIPINPSDLNTTLNYIGKSQFPDALFNGQISDFSIYNFALSADQIAEIAVGAKSVNNLQVSARSSSSISITWDDLDVESGYRVEQSTDGTNWAFLGNTAQNVATWTESNLSPGTEHYYRVLPFNQIGLGLWSSTLGATPADSLPGVWNSQDIGVVGGPGAAINTAPGEWTLIDGGSDIWSTVDSFHYLYQPLTGDGEIVARVDVQENTHPFAKAGVMIRETLGVDSAYVLSALTPTNGAEFSRRTSTGAAATNGFQSGPSAPYWIKLVRESDLFTAYSSVDGVNWIQVGTETILMANQVFIGLATTSHNTNQLNTSSFSQVAITNQVNQPEINIQGNGVDITDGDSTPSMADHTNIGFVSTANGGFLTRTFTVQNTGNSDLNVSGISVSGNDSADFSITNFTAGNVVAGGSMTFDIIFDPSADGIRNANVEIVNDDADENPYNFAISGFGIPQNLLVDNPTDENDGDFSAGDLSLREAIILANANVDVNTITFDASLDGTPIVLTMTGSDEDAAATGDLDVLTDINIIGNGANQTIINAGGDSGLGDRLFDVLSGGSLSLSGVTLTGGRGGVDGGGSLRINAGGSAQILDAYLTDNSTSGSGGGVLNQGELTVTRTTFSGNSAAHGGGVLSEGAGASLTVINSTVSGNHSDSTGGGIANLASSVALIVNSTIVLNTGGGIDASGNETLHNTIVAGNLSSGVASDLFGTVETAFNNLIGDAGSAAGIVNGTNVNIVGVNVHSVLDSTLRNHGGSTLTHALLPDSPALNRGNNALAVDENLDPLNTDQRGAGFDRIVGGRVDIGAFEGFLDPLSSLLGFYNGNWWMSAADANGVYDRHVAASGPASTFQKVLTGDFNGDGLDDLAAWLFNGEWRVGLNDGNGHFTFSTWTKWTHPSIKEIHVGDFNNDGKDDIIGLFEIANRNRGRWWVGVSNGSRFVNRSWGDFGNFSGLQEAIVGNFDGVKGDDLVVMTATGNIFMVKTSNSSFQYRYSHNWSVNSGINFMQAGDFNGDGRDDIVAVFGTGTNRSIFVAKSLGPATSFASLRFSNLTASESLDSLVVGDFNGDGKDDVAARINTTDWWLGLAGVNVFNFTFGTNWAFAANGVHDIHVGSTNGDANSDIIGRDVNGNWFSAESNGSSLTNRVIETWAPVDWQFVNGGDFQSQPTPELAIPPAPAKQDADESTLAQLSNRWVSKEADTSFSNHLPTSSPAPLSLTSDEEKSNEDYAFFGDPSLMELLYS